MNFIKINGTATAFTNPISYEQILKLANVKGKPIVSYYSPMSKYACTVIPGDFLNAFNGDIIDVVRTGRG